LAVSSSNENKFMKVILCTGGPNSGYLDVFETLVKSGAVGAKPASPTDFHPQMLQAEMLKSHEVDLNGTGPLAQILPGKLWSQLASRLFLANISYPVWGWADHQTVVWMDFWQEFDPQVRMTLVYQTPQAHLADALGKMKVVTSSAIAAELDQWMHWNAVLLRYCLRHPTRCVLVNREKALENPHELVTAVASKWKISELNAAGISPGESRAYPRLQSQLIDQLIDSQHPALMLCQELDGTATLPSEQSLTPPVGSVSLAAWADWISVRDLLDEIARQNSDLIVGHETAKNTVAQLERQLARAALAANVASDVGHENELLRLQLDQVETELEHYFLRCQELDNEQLVRQVHHEADTWCVDHSLDMLVDMRLQAFEGSNWYHAESDGRWAGPELVSSLKMPVLHAGSYMLVLEVVDAMKLDIVQNMAIEIFGQSVLFDIEHLSGGAEYPLICRAKFGIGREFASIPWRINLRFPQVVCPAEGGADDHRRLAIRLKSVRLTQNA
jgi:hypothetical protein